MTWQAAGPAVRAGGGKTGKFVLKHTGSERKLKEMLRPTQEEP
jgi:hypothetical protein